MRACPPAEPVPVEQQRARVDRAVELPRVGAEVGLNPRPRPPGGSVPPRPKRTRRLTRRIPALARPSSRSRATQHITREWCGGGAARAAPRCRGRAHTSGRSPIRRAGAARCVSPSSCGDGASGSPPGELAVAVELQLPSAAFRTRTGREPPVPGESSTSARDPALAVDVVQHGQLGPREPRRVQQPPRTLRASSWYPSRTASVRVERGVPDPAEPVSQFRSPPRAPVATSSPRRRARRTARRTAASSRAAAHHRLRYGPA